MNKFFTIEKKKKSATKKTPSKIGCEKCGLYKTCNSPKMEVIGKGLEKILIVGSKPGGKEDETGVQMVGESGKLIKRLLDSYELDFDEDCWKTNAVRCRPIKNITNTHINCCRNKLFETVKELKPEKVFLLGNEAMQSYFGLKTSTTGIEKWTGAAIPDYENQCWVFPMHHPAALFIQSKNIPLKNIFYKNFKHAIRFNKELPTNDFESKVQIIKDVSKATRILKRIKSGDEFVFDYETTGIKPYAAGHEILCMSIALSEKRVCAFPFFDDPFFAAQLRRIFLDS
jgi:DNA polymerase